MAQAYVIYIKISMRDVYKTIEYSNFLQKPLPTMVNDVEVLFESNLAKDTYNDDCI